jgi:hypothetical protein
MRILFAVLAAATLASVPALADPAADVALRERGRAMALDDRCGLLTDGARAALAGGLVLARNALLRSGWPENHIDAALNAAARSADELACDGADAAEIMRKVRAGYEGWRGLARMTFVGDHRTWSAQRGLAREGWLLVQDVSGTDGQRAVFGLAQRADGAARLALAVPADVKPRSARLLLRDTAVAPTLIGGELRRLASPRAPPNPLAAHAAPDVFTRAVWASERTDHDADSPLATGFDRPITVLWFPDSATGLVGALDAREAVAIDLELAARNGAGTTKRLYLEVGDFQAGVLFASLTDQSAP